MSPRLPARARRPGVALLCAIVVLLALGVTADLTGPQPATEGTVTVREQPTVPVARADAACPDPATDERTETRVSVAAPGAEEAAEPDALGRARLAKLGAGGGALPLVLEAPAAGSVVAAADGGRWWPGRPAPRPPAWPRGCSPAAPSTPCAASQGPPAPCPAPTSGSSAAAPWSGSAAGCTSPTPRRHRPSSTSRCTARTVPSTHRPAAAYRSLPAARRSGCSTRWPRASPGSRFTSTRAAAGSPPPCGTSSSTA